MKTLKAICTTAILTLAFTASVAAGEITTPGCTPPPPPPPESNITVDLSAPTETPSDLVDMSTPGFAEMLWVLASMF